MRISKRGSPRLREGLYNAALPAMRVNPGVPGVLRAPSGRGKHHKSARTAVAGKLLVQCWAVMRSGKSFEIPEKYASLRPTEKETTTFPSAPPSLEKGDASRPSSTSQESPQGPSREPKVVRKV